MNDDKLLGCIGAILTFLILVVVGTVASGYALSVLWGWFVVPTFELPALTIIQALGISLVVNYFTSDLQRTQEESKEKSYTKVLFNACLKIVLRPLIFLFLGWVYLQFM